MPRWTPGVITESGGAKVIEIALPLGKFENSAIGGGAEKIVQHGLDRLRERSLRSTQGSPNGLPG